MSQTYSYDYHLCRFRGGEPGKAPAPAFGPLPGETRMIDLPGARVRANLAGSGKHTVLLSPDPPHVLESYAPVIRTLADRFRVLTFESPGFGYSRPTRRYDFSLEALADIIAGVMDASETPRVISAVPCGNGFGALRFARLHPDRIEALLSVQTPEFGEYLKWIERVDPTGEIRVPLKGQRHLARNVQEVSRGWLRIAENDRAQQALYIEESAGHLHNGACYCLASALQQFVATENPFHDWRLDRPTAILWGGSDKTYRHAPHFSFAAYAPTDREARTVAIPGVGHFPEMSRPDLLLELLAELAAAA
ncbi:MAG: alpha/beta hydrolase [bacterium]|nr:alpha/beta hydrolase [bacterium]